MTPHARTSRIPALLVASVMMIAGAPHPLALEAMEGPPLWRVGDENTSIFLFGLPNFMDGETPWRTDAFDAALQQAGLVGAASAGTPVSYLEASTALLSTLGELPEDSQVRIFRQAIAVLEAAGYTVERR